MGRTLIVENVFIHVLKLLITPNLEKRMNCINGVSNERYMIEISIATTKYVKGRWWMIVLIVATSAFWKEYTYQDKKKN